MLNMNARIEAYLPLSRKISRSYWQTCPHIEFEELFGTACVALVKSAKEFEEKQLPSLLLKQKPEEEIAAIFGAYIATSIHNSLNKFLDWRKRQVHTFSLDASLFDDEQAEGDQGSSLYEKLAVIDEGLECVEIMMDLYPFVACLSLRERRLLELRLRDQDQKVCCAALGSDQPTISKMLKRIAMKYRTFQQLAIVSMVY